MNLFISCQRRHSAGLLLAVAESFESTDRSVISPEWLVSISALLNYWVDQKMVICLNTASVQLNVYI